MTYIDEMDDGVQYGIISIFSLATIAVVVYMVFGSFVSAYVAIALFALGFIAICTASIRKIFVILNYKEKLEDYEKMHKDELSENFKTKKLNADTKIKSCKAKELTKAILSGIFGVFTIIVLVLF